MSTLITGLDPTGKEAPFQVDASGKLLTSSSAPAAPATPVQLTPTATPTTGAGTVAAGAQSITVTCDSGTVTVAGGRVLAAGDVVTWAAPYPYQLGALAITGTGVWTAIVAR